MKLFIVIDETVFFHPEFLQDFICKTKDEITGAALVTKIPKKSSLEWYMISHFWYLYPSEAFRLGFRQIKLKLSDQAGWGAPHSVRHVLEHNKIPFKEVKLNINTDENLNFIRSMEPDIIISSQSLYFGRELLAIPHKCCINRHSGLLPRNGGLWPGFQAVRKAELESGVSVHVMEREIDAGQVLSQVRIPVREKETVWGIYEKCFAASADVIIEAVEKIRRSDYTPVNNGYRQEYYSFPTAEHWKEFRQRNGRYI